MAEKSTKPYVKLPGRGRRGWVVAVGFTSLWMAEDHFLHVESTRISEDYKRFYFKDIKAIVVRETTRWLTIAWALVGLAALIMAFCGWLAFLEPPQSRLIYLIVGGSIAGPLFLCAVIDLLLGPTCVCHLHTPVQREELPSLGRVRTARRALERIRAAVETVQGPFGPAERESAEAIYARYAWSPSEIASAAPRYGTPPPLPGAAGSNLTGWKIALIAALLLDIGAGLLSINEVRGAFVVILSTFTSAAIGVISFALLARLPLHASKAAARARIALWGLWLAVGSVYGFIGSVLYGIQHPGEPRDIVKIMETLPPSYKLVVRFALVTYCIWVAAEIAALVRAKKQPAPLATPAPTAETAAPR